MAGAAQDLPGPAANPQLVPKGSLVIPMDNAKQSLTAPFNLRAYGLVNDLLQNNIPVKWAIRAGKAKDGTDFTAEARRVAPSVLAPAVLAFSGGPFIVHESYAAPALARIAAFGGNVAVYELTRDTTIDIRHDLTFKPRAFVNAQNSDIATNILAAAGIANYTVGNDFTLLSGSCYTLAMEPHNDNPAGVVAIRAFLQSGGNFLAQCRSVDTYENNVAGRFLTTLGIAEANAGNVLSHPNPDLAFSQFVGTLEPAPGGSHQDWRLLTGSVFQNSGHIHADNVGASPARYAALASKLYAGGPGGMSFYLGGHDWAGSTLPYLNGQRMMLNALMTPPTRPPSCGLAIAVPDLAISKSHTGSFIEGAIGVYTLTVSNTGTTATVDTILVTDTLPAGLTYVTAGGAGWTVSAAGQVVTARYPAALAPGAGVSVQLAVAAGAAAVPSVTNRARVSGGGEVNLANNTASDPTVVLRGYDLLVRATAAPDPVAFTGTLTYTIRVLNLAPGAGAAPGVALIDSLPGGVTMISATPSQGGCVGTAVLSCALGAIGNGDSASVAITARVAATGSLTNVARAYATDADPDSTNNRATTIATAVPATVRDVFGAIGYGGNDGSHPWAGTWAEWGEPTNPAAGNIQVVASAFCAAGNCLAIGGNGVDIDNLYVTRGADLTGATSAALTFSYRRQALGAPGGGVDLQVSGDGGSSWTTLRTFTFGGSTDPAQQPRSCDISPYIGPGTRVRFLGSGATMAAVLHVDDVQIEYSDQPPAASGCVSLAATQLGFVVDPGTTEVDRHHRSGGPGRDPERPGADGGGRHARRHPRHRDQSRRWRALRHHDPQRRQRRGHVRGSVDRPRGEWIHAARDVGDAGGRRQRAVRHQRGLLCGARRRPGDLPRVHRGEGARERDRAHAAHHLRRRRRRSAGRRGGDRWQHERLAQRARGLDPDRPRAAGGRRHPGGLVEARGGGRAREPSIRVGRRRGRVRVDDAVHGPPWREPHQRVDGERRGGQCRAHQSFRHDHPRQHADRAPGRVRRSRRLDRRPRLPGHAPLTMDRSGTATAEPASGGAGHVRQPAAGASGTSTFTLTASHAARLVTLAIAPGDTVPPAAVTNLATQYPMSTSVGLTWTAPGDDGGVGRAASYDVRYSTTSITLANWATRTQAAGEPAPQLAGSAESFTVPGLSPGTLYYFAVRTTDDRGNVSGLSNVASATTTTCSTVTTVAQLRTQVADPACTIINVAPGTYLLTASGSGPLDIKRNVTIQRAGLGEVVLDAKSVSAVIDVTEDRTVDLIGLTIQGGQRDDGAGVRVNKGNALLRLTNSTVRNNTGKNGAGIYSKSPLILDRSTIHGNVAPDNGGAGVFIDGGSAHLHQQHDQRQHGAAKGGWRRPPQGRGGGHLHQLHGREQSGRGIRRDPS